MLQPSQGYEIYLKSLNDNLSSQAVCDQEKRLIAAALEAFTKKSYIDATVQDIVSIARASKSTFYKYYDNKEAVLIRILHLLTNVLIEKVEHSLQAHPPTSKRTFYAIRAYIETCFLHREITKLLMVDTVGVAPSLEKIRQELHQYFAGIFHREISQALRNDQRIQHSDAWVLSYAMVGAVQQVIIQSLIVEVPPNPDHLAGVLETMLSRSLRKENSK
jgi:AcrR family transcriptional regulator